MTIEIDDVALLMARLFLAALFLIFGWRKVSDYSGTVSQMARDNLPMPRLAAAVSIFMELPVAFAIAAGALTRLSALLMFFYTLGTSLAEHDYWKSPAAYRLDKMESFYKNLSIMGGFLLVFVTGAGKYSLDALLNVALP